MDQQELEQIGDTLRRLGHERREVVEQIVASRGGSEAGTLYRELDDISHRCIDLMERQRSLIRQELTAPQG